MESNTNEGRKLSISEMAQIHGLSRQTLIYYDKIDLFKPFFIDKSNSYRFYSPTQIPKLREICFLRSIGMPIEEIKKHNSLNSSISTSALLLEQKNRLEAEIEELNKQLEMTNERLMLFSKTKKNEIEPYFKKFHERFLVYNEITGKPSRETLYEALMRAISISERSSILPTSLYGTLFREESVKSDAPLKKVCACYVIDEAVSKKLIVSIKLPAGEYLCVKKHGMSYNLTVLKKMLKWMEDNGYELTGDIYEESLMDGGLYDNPKELDFSEIQIPVRKVV